ncbi:hypothetical protein [Pontibacter sp. G13]|uniref:hypothetical protein n=1 Tax=Pontibacter sp. G13 TaxID=3074898 RepID=UPI00288A56E3|nr:hypothetical protein [Pontibacter sp. G13]WNJ17728.1 hypothetical protein RJD25_22990 [Pontibacter sp. G13]
MTENRKLTLAAVVMGLAIVGYIIAMSIRMKKWQSYLNSPDRIITTVTVYDYVSNKGSYYYYYYVYKAFGDFYFEKTTGRNISRNKLDKGEPQTFVAVVSGKDPTIHCILWNRKFKQENILGVELNLDVDSTVIRYYTRGIGLSPRGSIDPELLKEIEGRVKM